MHAPLLTLPARYSLLYSVCPLSLAAGTVQHHAPVPVPAPPPALVHHSLSDPHEWASRWAPNPKESPGRAAEGSAPKINHKPRPKCRRMSNGPRHSHRSVTHTEEESRQQRRRPHLRLTSRPADRSVSTAARNLPAWPAPQVPCGSQLREQPSYGF